MPRKKSDAAPAKVSYPSPPIAPPEIKPKRRTKAEIAESKDVRAATPAERIEHAWKLSGGTMKLRVTFFREDHAKEAAEIIRKKKYYTLEAHYDSGPVPKGVLV
jgi:hypothetical protein